MGIAVRQSLVLLLVVPIKISANGRFVETKTLLDSGSQLIPQDVVDELGLEGTTQNIRFGTFHVMDPEIHTKKVSFLLSSKDGAFSVSVNEVYSVEALNISPGEVDLNQLRSRWEHLSDLDLAPVDLSDVTVLIEMNVRPAHDNFDSRKPDRSEAPEAVLTPFGWEVVGPTGKKTYNGQGRCFHLSASTEERDERFNAQVERFLSTESLG